MKVTRYKCLTNFSVLLALNDFTLAYQQKDFVRLILTNHCPRCELTFVNLNEVVLNNADLTGANLNWLRLEKPN